MFKVKFLTRIEHDNTVRGEFEARRKNGQIFPSEHTLKFVPPSHAQPALLVSVVRDISRRKQNELELLKSRELFKKAQEIAHLGW